MKLMFVVLMILIPTAAISAQEKGLKKGEKAPSFELKDQNGQPQTLTGLLEKGNVALVFYRSADW